MNSEEKVVENFLIVNGYKSIVHEPHGVSKPPDFRIEGNIGIEVRRLNKHVYQNGTFEPIEKLEYEFIPKFKKLLLEIDNPELSYSIGLSLIYKRPFKVSKKLLFDLKTSIINSTKHQLFGKEVYFNTNIVYLLFKGDGKSAQTYELVIQSDRDKGGIVQDARYEATKICIYEKSEKLKSIKDKYSELWLILVDTIFSRVDYTTKQDFRQFPEIKSFFKRIIIISKRNSSNWIDLYPW